jgi:hypothetical protein
VYAGFEIRHDLGGLVRIAATDRGRVAELAEYFETIGVRLASEVPIVPLNHDELNAEIEALHEQIAAARPESMYGRPEGVNITVGRSELGVPRSTRPSATGSPQGIGRCAARAKSSDGGKWIMRRTPPLSAAHVFGSTATISSTADACGSHSCLLDLRTRLLRRSESRRRPPRYRTQNRQTAHRRPRMTCDARGECWRRRCTRCRPRPTRHPPTARYRSAVAIVTDC